MHEETTFASTNIERRRKATKTRQEDEQNKGEPASMESEAKRRSAGKQQEEEQHKGEAQQGDED